jgi:hypothetical protein
LGTGKSQGEKDLSEPLLLRYIDTLHDNVNPGSTVRHFFQDFEKFFSYLIVLRFPILTPNLCKRPNIPSESL